MCGIAGFSLSGKETKLDSRLLTGALLGQIVTRGRDATGIAYLTETEDGESRYSIRKAPVPATQFGTRIKAMPIDTPLAICHTRWATQGDPADNLNNHPIVAGKIIGVHNGHLTNDDQLFAHLGAERRGEVDSEAAFALLNATSHHPTEVLKSLDGRAALAWLDTKRRGTLQLARCCDSPLAIGQTRRGSVVFASTMPLLQKACFVAGISLSWADEVEEYTYLSIRNGVIHECLEIGESVKQVA